MIPIPSSIQRVVFRSKESQSPRGKRELCDDVGLMYSSGHLLWPCWRATVGRRFLVLGKSKPEERNVGLGRVSQSLNAFVVFQFSKSAS